MKGNSLHPHRVDLLVRFYVCFIGKMTHRVTFYCIIELHEICQLSLIVSLFSILIFIGLPGPAFLRHIVEVEVSMVNYSESVHLQS